METTTVETRCLAPEECGEAWDRFVNACPEANLGHLRGWSTVFRKAYRKRIHAVVASTGDEWLGLLPVVPMRGPLSGNRLVSLPYLDRAGPLVSTPEARSALIQAAADLAGRLGARGLDIRTLATEPVDEAARATLILDFPRTVDDLWKSFKPKVRNQIRKAEKSGLTTEPAAPDRIGDFYRIYARNMRDLGSPPHSRRFFLEMWAAFPDRARLYLTHDETGRPVGGAVAISFSEGVTVPWASSLRDVFRHCPNHSLYWKILADAVEGNSRWFDFGRSHRDSGTWRFKTQWGATPRPLDWLWTDPRGQATPSGVLKPSEHGRLVRVWSRLPLWVTNTVGPVIRRQISN